MKTIILILLLALLLGLVGVTTVAALSVFGPFHPGQALFGVQTWAERSYELVAVSSESRVQYSLTLLERRVADLEWASGSSFESEAVSAISNQVDRVLGLLSETPGEPDADFRALFIQNLDRLLAALEQTKLLPGDNPQGLNELSLKIQALKGLAENSSNSLSGLAAADITSRIGQALAAEKSLIGQVSAGIDPRIVPFPPGSQGAQHLFFPLDGKHAELVCQSCHRLGNYSGTPNLCSDCHNQNQPAGHYAGECSLCHVTAAWLPANFDHLASVSVDCQSCHLNSRPANHYPGQCSACHTTNAWKPASFDHQVAGAVDCQACHIDRKPANHWGGQCSACHSTSGWLPARFNHQAAGATDCQACHTRPANHFGGQCSDCHSTNGWAGASFNHTFPTDHGGAGGVCSRCHPSGSGSFTCFTCHNEPEMTKKHNEKGIPDYVARCLACHYDGRKHED